MSDKMEWSEWTDGMRVGIDDTEKLLTIEWEEDSIYSEWCEAVERDNNVLFKALEEGLNNE